MTIQITDTHLTVDEASNEPTLKIYMDFDVVYAIERLQQYGKDEFANEIGLLFIAELHKLL